jgi:hypothetical protein
MTSKTRPLFDPTDENEPEPDQEVLDLLEEEGPPDEDEGTVYNGRRVRWLGEEGRMYKARWDQVHPVAGNIFYEGKLPAFLAYAKEQISRGEKPLWQAPAGWVGGAIDVQDIEESQQSAQHGPDDLYHGYGTTRPYTTGDEEVDEYLRDRRDMKKRLAKCIEDDAEVDYERDELAETIEAMEARVAEIVAKSGGDLGTVTIQLRDGNHRAFSSYLLGEPYVWVYITPGHEGALKDDLE